MKNQRYLTKSRFKFGVECSTKLHYTKKARISKSKKWDDAFSLYSN